MNDKIFLKDFFLQSVRSDRVQRARHYFTPAYGTAMQLASRGGGGRENDRVMILRRERERGTQRTADGWGQVRHCL